MTRSMVAALVVLVLAGCSSAAEEAGPNMSSGPSPYVAVLAPPVADPRDVRGIAACDLLTAEQKQGFGIDVATENQDRPDDFGGCAWRTLDMEGVLGVVGVQDPPVGLDGLYNVREAYPVFEPGEIDGRPIVRADFVDTAGRDCRIFIGVADDQMIQASAKYAFQPGRGCEVAREMAAAMIANLPLPG
ncbi:MAG: DUF3558 domain-containing protein [Pseudonocardia sp.]|nr:DUF3558 domain-containing protein [Pseudonocardia sp.]